VQNGAINQLKVAFNPSLDLPLGMDLEGIHMEKKGNEGVIKTDVNWLVDFIANLSGMPTASARFVLNLTFEQKQAEASKTSEPTREAVKSK